MPLRKNEFGPSLSISGERSVNSRFQNHVDENDDIIYRFVTSQRAKTNRLSADRFGIKSPLVLSMARDAHRGAPPGTRFHTRTFSPRARPTGVFTRVRPSCRTPRACHAVPAGMRLGHLRKVAREGGALPSSTCRQKDRPPPVSAIPRLPRIWSPFGRRS